MINDRNALDFAARKLLQLLNDRSKFLDLKTKLLLLLGESYENMFTYT